MPRTESELTMVLVTRGDLDLSRGKLAAQCGHAVAECVLKAKREEPRMLKRYMKEGARKVVCAAPNLEALRRLFGDARVCGLVYYMVTDAGHTEIPAGTVTVLGIGPGPRSEIDPLTSSLPLVK